MDTTELISIAERLEEGAFEGNSHFHFEHNVLENGEMRIAGDQGALREFAAQIIRMIARPYREGAHQHFDEFGSSEEGSAPLVVRWLEEGNDK